MSTIGKSFIERNKFGVWQVNYYCKVKKRGLVTSLFTKDEKEANKKYEVWKAERILGIVKKVEVSSTPFYLTALEDFKADLKDRHDDDLSDKTILAHQTAGNYLVRVHGNKPLDQYGIIRVKNDLPNKSKATHNTYSKHLHAQFQYFISLSNYYGVTQNPIVKVKKPKSEPHPIPFEYLQEYFTACKEKNVMYYHCAKLAYLCAYRREELVHVFGSDFDFESRIFKVQNLKAKRTDKTGNPDYLPMLDDIYDFLKNEYFKVGKFFPFTTGDSIYSFWYDIGIELVNQGKIPHIYQFHSLRDTRATNLKQQGKRDEDVQFFMRHTDIKITRDSYMKELADKAKNNAKSALSRMNAQLDGAKVYSITG